VLEHLPKRCSAADSQLPATEQLGSQSPELKYKDAEIMKVEREALLVGSIRGKNFAEKLRKNHNWKRGKKEEHDL